MFLTAIHKVVYSHTNACFNMSVNESHEQKLYSVIFKYVVYSHLMQIYFTKFISFISYYYISSVCGVLVQYIMK